MIFDVTCPNGTTASVVIPAGEMSFTLPFPVEFVGEYPPLVMPCEGSFIIRTIASGSTQEDIDAIVEEMFQTCGRQKAEARACIPIFGNDQVVFDVGCAAGETASFSGTLPSWITLDDVNNQLVGAAGTFTGASSAAANAAAQSALDSFGNQQIALGNLTCAPPSVCVAADGTLAVNPTLELAMSSDASVRRMMSTSFGSQAIDVIDTATDALVVHIAPGYDPAYPVFAPSNSTFWVQNYSTDELKKYNSNGTLLTTIIPSPGDVLSSPMTYESNTGKIYFTVQGANYIVYELDPSTNAVVAGNNFGPPGGNFPVFSTPGKIFVSGIPASGADGDIFDIYSVPGYAHVGTLPTTSSGTSQQCFAYCPDNGKAYLTAIIAGNAEVWEINPATGSVDFVYTLDPEFAVAGMSYDPINKRIFLVEKFAGTGVVINPLTRTVVCTLSMTAFTFSPDCLVCDPVTGVFYYSDSVNGLISKWT